ncbi:MAG: hypothetical protein ACI9U5_001765 [Colwellia sp.]|jgi:hypothetical protein
MTRMCIYFPQYDTYRLVLMFIKRKKIPKNHILLEKINTGKNILKVT